MRKYMIRKIPVVIGFAVLGMAAFSGVVMLLWNGILPAVLHISAITIWQAAGILLLSRILFGGFKGRRAHGCGEHKRRMFRKWQSMNPEERDNARRFAC